MKHIRKEALVAYLKINHKWLTLHYHVLLLCISISSISEIIIYFIIRFTGTIYSTNIYWLKYIIVPITIGASLVGIAYLIIKNQKIKIKIKYYAMSILMVFAATNLSFAHSGYESILLTFLLPILMTIMYEDQRLTVFITCCTIPLEIYTGLSMFWDPYKSITHAYLINLFITVILTIVTWMVSYYMIKFSLMKKNVVIERDVERQQLKEKVLMDDLTKVGSKNALLQRLQDSIQHHQIFHLAMIDIDDFKMINDQYGHLYGDDVLSCLGESLNKMQSNCCSYRYGGDEFCIIFYEEDKKHILQAIEEMKRVFVSLLRYSKQAKLMNVTISVGVAMYHEEEAVLDIIKHADDALYESKKKSKNTVTYYA